MIRVLIVEDDPLIAEAHRQYTLRLPGFDVFATVGTGQAAVRTVATAAADDTPIDLVLLDIGLPDASGIDVASALNGVRPSPTSSPSPPNVTSRWFAPRSPTAWHCIC